MSILKLTVIEFNEILADVIHNQLQLNQLCISGEISQLNYYNEKKHLYFTLSQENAHLQCVIYNQHLKKIPLIKKGDQCNVFGACKYLKNKGQLIFSCVNISLDGEGKRNHRLTKQIETFRKKGFLSKKTDKEIPRLIEKVCIITSNKSAAYFDINKILNSSTHFFECSHISSSVQGLLAPQQLREAIHTAELLQPDIICITRGGGADQDFDCFHEESVASKIYQSKTPIICGIGHEINTTLACLCANKDFATPTEMIQWLINHSMAPVTSIKDKLLNVKHELEMNQITIKQQLVKLKDSAKSHFNNRHHEIAEKVNELRNSITLLNPMSKLSQGFIYCETKNKKPLKTIQQLKKNDRIYMKLSNGSAEAVIDHVNKN